MAVHNIVICHHTMLYPIRFYIYLYIYVHNLSLIGLTSINVQTILVCLYWIAFEYNDDELGYYSLEIITNVKKKIQFHFHRFYIWISPIRLEKCVKCACFFSCIYLCVTVPFHVLVPNIVQKKIGKLVSIECASNHLFRFFFLFKSQ